MLASRVRSGQSVCPMALSARDRAILDFERECWTHPGPKDAAIRAHLRLSPTRYYERLRALADDREAYAYDPMTVLRTRRRAIERRRERIEGRRAGPDRP